VRKRKRHQSTNACNIRINAIKIATTEDHGPSGKLKPIKFIYFMKLSYNLSNTTPQSWLFLNAFLEFTHKFSQEFFPARKECVRNNCMGVLLAIFIAVACGYHLVYARRGTKMAKDKQIQGIPEKLPHDNYEQIVNEITERYPQLSERQQQAARYITQNPNTVALESINAVAAKCGMHPSVLVRFAQLFGYSGFKQMQSVFQTRLATAAPGYNERITALENDLRKNNQKGSLGFLQSLVIRDIATLQELLNNTAEKDLDKTAQLLKDADTIYIAGQLRSEPVASLLRYLLTMLNRRVILLDSSGGLAPQMANNMREKDVLIAIAFRHYAKEVIAIADDAGSRNNPVIAITDSQLSPLAKSASVLFTVPEEEYSFSRSLAAPVCLAQSIAMALASALEPDKADPQIETITEREKRAESTRKRSRA
jgi:DNA-binding MurR/RpiR family transcriptional regulator